MNSSSREISRLREVYHAARPVQQNDYLKRKRDVSTWKESTTHRLPRYAFSRSRKSVTPRLRTRSHVIYLLRRLLSDEEREREKEKNREERAENVSLVMVGPLSTRFDASVTGASEPGTGSLVKHATVHLPWHHSLPLFPFAPFFSLLFFSHPSSTESRSRFLSFCHHPSSRFSLAENLRRCVPKVPSPLSSIFSLLLSFITHYRNSTVYRLSLTFARD